MKLLHALLAIAYLAKISASSLPEPPKPTIKRLTTKNDRRRATVGDDRRRATVGDFDRFNELFEGASSITIPDNFEVSEKIVFTTLVLKI
jgi:hypothetical protein